MDEIILQQFDAIFSDPEYQTDNAVAILANSSALINQLVPDLNWAGFYLWHQEKQQLELGPFQGKIACSTIASATGVCGTAYAEQRPVRVANVHEFAGHIACDAATDSELVIPLTFGDQRIGVLDLDSPKLDRFSERDQTILVQLAAKIATLLTRTASTPNLTHD